MIPGLRRWNSTKAALRSGPKQPFASRMRPRVALTTKPPGATYRVGRPRVLSSGSRRAYRRKNSYDLDHAQARSTSARQESSSLYLAFCCVKTFAHLAWMQNFLHTRYHIRGMRLTGLLTFQVTTVQRPAVPFLI